MKKLKQHNYDSQAAKNSYVFSEWICISESYTLDKCVCNQVAINNY